jgi:phage-related protein
MASYNVGEAFLSIVPSFKGVAQAIDSQAGEWGVSAGKTFASSFNKEVKDGTNNTPLGPSDEDTTEQGSNAAGKFADAFKARLEAALKSLPEIEIDADTSDAEKKIAEIRSDLETLADQRIGVDVDETTALAQLDRLKAELDEVGARSPSVRIQVDTAAASAELAAFQAEVDAVGGTDGGAFAGISGALEGVDGGLIVTAGLIAALGTIAIPVGAALIASFAGVATVFGAIVGAVGVAALAFSGVSKTVGLLNQQQTASASTGTGVSSSLNEQASAAQQLSEAERGLQQARAEADNAAINSAETVKNARQALAAAETAAAKNQVQAAQAVQAAEQQLAQASQQSTSAQQALNDAREQAARDLQSYANNAVDTQQTAEQAGIDLTTAQNQLTTDQAPGSTATPLQIQQDQLNIAKATQALKEAQEAATQATQDNNKAQKDGIANAPGVVAAQQQVSQAQQQQTAAVKALKAAQQAVGTTATQSTQQIKKAQQSLSDAIRAQALQQKQSADSVKNAEDSVSSAMRGVQDAAKAAGDTGTSSLGSINDQLAKVNPATLALAKFVQGTLEPAFDKLKAAAAAGLLPGVEQALKNLAPLFAPLTTFVGKFASGMGTLAVQASKALTGPFWKSFFAWIGSTANKTLGQFVKIVENLGGGFAGLLKAFSPVTNAIGSGLDKLTGKFAAFGESAGNKNSPFQAFLAYVKQYGPAVGQLLGQLAQLFGNLLVDLAPLGGVVLTVVGAFAKWLNTLSPSELLAVTAAIGGIIALISGPIGLAVVIVAAAGLVVKNWAKITGAFSDAWDWVKNFFSQNWSLILGLISGPIGLSIVEVVKHWGSIKAAFSDAGSWISGTFSKAWNAITGAITAPVSNVIGDAKSGLTKAWSDIKAVFSDAKQWISGTFSTVWGAITDAITSPIHAAIAAIPKLWGDIEDAFATAVNFVTQKIMNPLIDALDTALSVFGVKIGTIAPIVVQKPNLGGSDDAGTSPSGGSHALGGVTPGYAPGRDSLLARVSPGEGFIVPEAVRGLGGASAIQAINATYSGRVSAPPGFSLGGVIGSIGGAISGVVSSAIHTVRSGVADAAAASLSALETPIKAVIGAAPSGFAQTLASGLLDKVNTAVKSFIAGNTDNSGNSGNSAPVPTGQHKSLITQGLSAAGAKDTAGNESAVNLIISKESSWDADAVNKTDSNWKAGHPSVGLMQVIEGTFKKYVPTALANVGPFAYGVSEDDVANMAAGIRYAIATYNSLGNVPGVVAVNSGKPYVGYDSGGWLPPGITAAVNNTGKPEPIFTHAQASALMDGAAGGGNAPASSPNWTVQLIGDGLDDMVRTVVRDENGKAVKYARRRMPGRTGGVAYVPTKKG